MSRDGSRNRIGGWCEHDAAHGPAPEDCIRHRFDLKQRYQQGFMAAGGPAIVTRVRQLLRSGW